MADRQAVIVRAVRTPFMKSFTEFGDLDAVDLATQCVGHLLADVAVEDIRPDDVIYGCVTPPAGGVNIARDMVLRLGLGTDIPGTSLTRACASSLSAMGMACDGIRAGTYDTVIVGGVESLSRMPIPYSPKGLKVLQKAMKARSPLAKLKALLGLRPGMLLPQVPSPKEPTTGLTMGEHCEQMAKDWGISREDQDDLAFASHEKAHAAESNGGLPGPIVPVYAGRKQDRAVVRDNGIRRPPDRESLRPLRSAFDKVHGTLSAGNSSFLTDGASAMLVMEEERARAAGFSSYLRLLDHKVVAIDPDAGLLMAPPVAIDRVLRKRGMALDDIEAFELHEAFAAQLLANLRAMECQTYCREVLDRDAPLGAIDPAKINPKGGSLAVGHPFAATGVRLIMGLKDSLEGKNGARGLASACAAGAMAQAVLVEAVEV